MRKAVRVCASACAFLAGCSTFHSDFGSSSANVPPQPPQNSASSAAAVGAQSSSAFVNPSILKATAATKEQDLRVAQRTLKDEGYYKGRVDGKSGPLTLAAIERFQKKKGLKQTGWLDQDTWNVLGISRTSGYGSSMPPSSNSATQGAK